MANKEINLKINGVDTAIKNIDELEKSIELLNEEIKTVGVNTKEFDTLAAELRKATSEMANLEKTLEGADTVKVAESFAKLGEGIAGGFAIATSASQLFGSESEDLAKAEAKAQQAIAIVMGARAIAESVVEGATAARIIKEQALLAIEKLKIVNTQILNAILGANTVATISQTAATEGATIAQKALNIAMKASPIGLLIAGLTALVAAVAFFSEENNESAEAQANSNKQTLASIELNQKLNDNILAATDANIKRLELQRAGGDKLYQEQLKRQQLALELAKTQEGIAIQAVNNTQKQLEGLDAESEEYKNLREQLDKLIESAEKSTKARIDASRAATETSLKEAQRITDAAIEAGKKVAEEQIKAEEEAKKRREEKLAAEQKLNDEIALSQIERIKDEETRELDKLRFDNDKKVEEIKNSKANQETKNAALTELELSYQNSVDEISEKYRLKRVDEEKKRLEDEKNLKLESINYENSLQQAKYDYEIALATDNKSKILQIQKEKLDAQYKADIDSAILKGENIKVIEEKYKTDTLLISQQIKEQKKLDDQEALNNGINTAKQSNDALQGLSDLAFMIKKKNLKAGSAEEEKAARQQFKINKGIQLAGAVIDGFKAVTSSLSQSPIAIGPVPNPAGIASLAFAAITSAVNIAKIASTQYEGGAGGSGAAPTAPNISAPAISQPDNTSTLFNADTINQSGTLSNNNPSVQQQSPIKVNLLESDVTKTQKKVNMAESLGSF